MDEDKHAALHDRFVHHPPTSDGVADAHQVVRRSCELVARAVVEVVPVGREQSLALTKIEEAMFWANAGIARGQ